MTTPFLGEIQIFAFSFPPHGWAYCNGQALAISQNSALYSLLGATFGGNGRWIGPAPRSMRTARS